MAKIGIVTVLYNSASVLEEYFKTLSMQTFKDFVLYVVDNKSPDASLALSYKYSALYADSYKTVFIKNDDNYGIAKGNNIGLLKAKQDGCNYILLCNNDIVMSNDCIEKLLSRLLTQKIDIVVPKIFYYDEPLIWMAGGKFAWFSGGTRHIGAKQKDSPRYNKYRLVSYSPTCVMLIMRELFEEIGLFDEKYFVYFDDTDWVYRCKIKEKKIGYTPDAVVWHKESVSTGGQMSDFSIRMQCRNHVYFCKKNFSKIHFFITVLTKGLFHLLFQRWKYSRHQRVLMDKSFLEGFKM